MPAKVEREGDLLLVKVFGDGSRGDDDGFKESLAAVKRITGKNYDPATKTWQFQADDAAALHKIVCTMEPELSSEVQGMVQEARRVAEDELFVKREGDGTVNVPWADEMYPYQRAGAEFIVNHPRSILGDDMGLGKTVEALSAAADYYHGLSNVRGIIICPHPVMDVWETTLAIGPADASIGDGDGREPLFKKWEGVGSVVIDGRTKAKRQAQVKAAIESEGWVIINWEKLRLCPELAKVKWDVAIADEAHRARNKDSQQTRALHKIKATMRIPATGTMLLNSPGDIWPLLKWVRPEQYTSYWTFDAQYVDSYQGRYKQIILGVRNPDALRFELTEQMIRRKKTHVLHDLPEKLPPQVIHVNLLPKQQRVYDEIQAGVLLDVRAAMEEAKSETALERIRRTVESGDTRALALLIPNAGGKLTRQRQCATSLALLGEEDIGATLDAAVETIRDHPDKQFVVFSWYQDTSRLIAERLSGGNPGDRIDCEPFNGTTPKPKRKDIIQRFQQGKLQVLSATIATGGAGITLHAADTCIFVEEDWVPAINQQAVDRLHRIGQKNAVSTIIFRARDTVHTKDIVPKLQLKQLMAEQAGLD